MGVIQDGINSALRYYFGNFSDGRRQDSLDLLFGAYKVNPINYTSPFHNIPTDPVREGGRLDPSLPSSSSSCPL